MENRLIETDSRPLVAALIVLVAVLLIPAIGCYKRNLAPSVEYSQSEVQTLNEEIEQMDW